MPIDSFVSGSICVLWCYNYEILISVRRFSFIFKQKKPFVACFYIQDRSDSYSGRLAFYTRKLEARFGSRTSVNALVNTEKRCYGNVMTFNFNYHCNVIVIAMVIRYFLVHADVHIGTCVWFLEAQFARM